MTAKERFFDWLGRKYGWDPDTFKTLDADFQAILVREYNEIARDYGLEPVIMAEVEEG